MKWNRFFNRSFIIVFIFCFVLFFALAFPRGYSSFIENDYEQLKTVVNSCIDFENKTFKSVEIPEDITLTIEYEGSEALSIMAANYYYESELLPSIRYIISLTPDFQIIDMSEDSISIARYTIRTALLFVLVDFFISVAISFLTLFLIAIIYDIYKMIKSCKYKCHYA